MGGLTEVPAMQQIDIDGIQLDVHDRGSGEPVVFVHGGMGDECFAVLAEPALTERFRLVHYHRRGWGRSSSEGLPLSIDQQAADCRAVMQQLGIDRTHLAGLSYGGTILLQFAIDHPEATHSLALLEPGLPEVMNRNPEYQALMAQVVPLLEAGDFPAALDTLFHGLVGPDYAAAFDRTLPEGWFDRWVGDFTNVLMPYDIPALQEWRFAAEDAARIDAPVLNISGADTASWFREINDTVQAWIPHAQATVLPESTHGMLQMNPSGAAEQLAQFFSQHPMRD